MSMEPFSDREIKQNANEDSMAGVRSTQPSDFIEKPAEDFGRQAGVLMKIRWRQENEQGDVGSYGR